MSNKTPKPVKMKLAPAFVERVRHLRNGQNRIYIRTHKIRRDGSWGAEVNLEIEAYSLNCLLQKWATAENERLEEAQREHERARESLAVGWRKMGEVGDD